MLVLHTLVSPVGGAGEVGDDASQPLLGLDRVLLQQQQSPRQVANVWPVLRSTLHAPPPRLPTATRPLSSAAAPVVHLGRPMTWIEPSSAVIFAGVRGYRV